MDPVPPSPASLEPESVLFDDSSVALSVEFPSGSGIGAMIVNDTLEEDEYPLESVSNTVTVRTVSVVIWLEALAESNTSVFAA